MIFAAFVMTIGGALFLALGQSISSNAGETATTDGSALGTKAERLGKLIFEDTQLSIRKNQACVSCHTADTGFTGPFENFNREGSVVEGSIAGRFGNTKPTSIAYASPAPVLHHRIEREAGEPDSYLFVGGSFNNGRATGKLLGNPVADQARQPFLNPLEMGLPDAACVVHRVCNPETPDYYSIKLADVWGKNVCNLEWPANLKKQCAVPESNITLTEETRKAVETAYDRIALSLLAFQSSKMVNTYSSKFDAYLAGKAKLTIKEELGKQLFEGRGGCAVCHVLDPGPSGETALFTDFTYDNLGVPRNPDNPFYTQKKFNPIGAKWVDLGLATTLGSDPLYKALANDQLGKVKVPTLRNVDKRPTPGFVKAFMHNGYFKSLKSVVHFYNTRDIKPACKNLLTREALAIKQNCWPEPELKVNVNKDELGDLKLTDTEEDAIVAFMRILSDGYVAKDSQREKKTGR